MRNTYIFLRSASTLESYLKILVDTENGVLSHGKIKSNKTQLKIDALYRMATKNNLYNIHTAFPLYKITLDITSSKIVTLT